MKKDLKTPAPIQNHYNYYHPINVRYADLDTQRHVNNTAVVTFLESARMGYYQASGIWDGRSFDDFGLVVAALKIDYLKPILFGQTVRVGLSVIHMGNKSLRFHFEMDDGSAKSLYARGEIVMVAFDPINDRSIPIPPEWRERINIFEKKREENDPA
ncbi:MAG: acyl-CoA thioesterase [Anaerolineaceae bacterium]|nr:acyl-CoA thioesterase [Anaerolineaceae bacterium]